MYTRSKKIETITRNTFIDYREKLIDRIDRRSWNRFGYLYAKRKQRMDERERFSFSTSRWYRALRLSRISRQDTGFMVRFSNKRQCGGYADRICSISTNRTLSIGQALCHRCVGIPVREASTPIGNSSATRGSGDGPSDPGACAGCGNQLREGQALVALDRQWHVWCLKCHSCDTVLHGEYMGK